MSNKLIKLISICFMSFILFSLKTNAKEWYEDYSYNLDNTNKTITLTKYNGSAKNVTVKSSVKINNVNYFTIINGDVYNGKTSLESIVFENGVKAGTTLQQLFYNCSNLESITFNNFDTSNVTNMYRMFRGSSKLTDLDLSNFNTSNVTNMSQMFLGLSNLEKLNISGFDTSKVENMDDMYDGLSISKFKTIVIGKKMNFHLTDNVRGGLFSRGTWKKEGTNEEYSTLEIASRSALGKGEGTYHKISNISQELDINFQPTYKIENLDTISSYTQSGSNNFIKLDNYEAFVYKVRLEDATDKSYDDSLTIHYDDAVTDARGNKYDFEIKIDNIKLHELKSNNNYDYGYIYIFRSYKNHYSLYKTIYGSLADADANIQISNGAYTDASYDVTLKVLNKDGSVAPGSFIFSGFDIDIGSYNDTGATYVNKNGDLGYGSHSEGVRLISGFDSNTITLAKSYSFLQNQGSNRYTGTRNDNSSEASEILVKANADGFKYNWTVGKTASTSFLNYYQPKTVLIENQNTLGDLIVGNKLVLLDAKGNEIEDWTTQNHEESVFLNPGKYILHQTSVVDDYIIASDIEFFVDIDNNVTIDGKSVNKVIIINGTPDNKYKITTEVVNGTISDSLYVLPGENGVVTYKANEGYSLKEIYVDGKLIEINENNSSYTFENVSSNHTIKVVYEIENPKTGSALSITLLSVLTVICVYSIYKYKKKKTLYNI